MFAEALHTEKKVGVSPPPFPHLPRAREVTIALTLLLSQPSLTLAQKAVMRAALDQAFLDLLSLQVLKIS